MAKDLFEEFGVGGDLFKEFNVTPQPPPEESAPGAILRQLKAGAVVELPQMLGQAAQYATEPGNLIYETGKGIADAAAARGKLPENAPIDESKHNTVTNALAGGARMIPQSLAPALAVGGALALAPEALAGGTLLGIAGAAGAVPAAMSQGQQTLEKLRESGVSEEEARKAARINAGIEFAGETAANFAAGKVLGIGAKALKGKTAADVVENAVDPSVLKPWLKATGTAAVVEPATEFGQNYGEAAVENAYGAKNEHTPWEAGVSSIAPTLGMTALLAPFGLVGHGMNASRSLKRTQALENPETDADARLAIANDLHQQLKDIDPAAADHFLNNVLPAIENNQPIKIDQGIILPPDVAGMDQANQALGHAVDQYTNIPGEQARLGFTPGVIQVPTQDGGTATIDRSDGAISAAVVDTGAGDMLRTGSLVRSYATQDEAANVLAGRTDADRMTIAAHPRDKSRFAVVPKSAQELAAIDAKAAATGENEARAAQLQAEEDARQADKDTQATQKRVADLHRSAAAIEKSINEGTPAKDAAIAREHAADLRAQAQELQGKLKETKTGTAKPAPVEAVAGDQAQDELAPAPVQPTTEILGERHPDRLRQAMARHEAEARGAQLVDEESAKANMTPTEAQIAAGNYQKGHVRVGSLDVSIENPAGSTRSGIENGKKWSTKMKDHYGYMKRTKGADGDQVDVYIKAGTPTDHTGPVYVVDQFNPKTGAFDEHKAMVGYGSLAEAQKAYDAHFSDKSGPARRGAVTEMTPTAFKSWAQNGDTTQPVSDARTEADKANEETAQSTGAKFAPKRGETQEQYHARRASEVNAKRGMAQTAAQADNTVADVREALGDPNAEVTTVALKDLPSAEAAGKDEVSRQAAGFLANVARMFGKKVVFVKDLPADGFYLRGNTLYLATTSSIHHLRVMGHEMLHALRNQAPKAYDRMIEAVGSLLTPEELRAQVRDYNKDMAEMSDEQVDSWLAESGNQDRITEEWLADLSGNRFAESSFWESVFTKIEDQHGSATAKGIIAQLKMALANALTKLLTLVRGNRFAVDARMGEHLEEIREAIATGFAGYAKAVKDGQLTEQNNQTKFTGKKPGSDNGHKRTAAGEYVGAPAGMTSAKLGALRTRLKALAQEGEPGRFWYEDSSDLILAASEGDKALAEKIAGLLAIYSPQATVSANTSMGLKALYQWMNGDPIRARFATQDKKAQAWMDGTMGEEDALQIKTGNFFKNLMRKIDEDRYGFEKQGATIDMWMARVFGYGSKAIGSEARYLFAERETKRLADDLGWEPQQVQAALWVAIKSRIEAIAPQAREIGQKNDWLVRKVAKVGGTENISWPPKDAASRELYEALILKMALATDADPSGLLKASYHFGTALKERVGQVSWEAMPGKTTGVLPGIFQAPIEQQAEYLEAMDKALRDENGQDLIAKKLGLPVIGTAMGPSAWQMNVGAGAQTEVAISTERDQGNKKISVSAPARSLLNLYSAIRGYVLAQEAVVWHYPIFDASKKNANGVQLDFGRDPTHDEVVSLYNAINAVSGRDDWAPAYVPGVGVRILNFSEVANTEFHKLVLKAANTLEAETHFQTFQSDGDYIGNDWVKNPDGAEYKEIINAGSQNQSRGSGRSDLQGWVESELRPRAERVNQEFADKYGWGPGRSEGSGLAAGEGRFSNIRVGQGGRTDVVGVHYSQEQRQHLTGVFFGSGIKSEEARRIFEAADSRIKSRLYAYVDEGKGVRPEQGVGGHAHRVQFDNLYDLKADPLGIRRKISDPNERESAILDAGFNGYYAPGVFGDQGVAILMGGAATKGIAPAAYLGTGYRGGEVAAPQQVEQKASPIAGRKDLPMGKMTGAEWKKLVPEAKVEDGQSYYKDDLRFSPARRFYSQLERTFEQAPDKVFGSAAQVKNWLVANAGKSGIKQDEIRWTGINDWLDLQGKTKVSKADVLGYLAQNGVKVEEVEKGGKAVSGKRVTLSGANELLAEKKPGYAIERHAGRYYLFDETGYEVSEDFTLVDSLSAAGVDSNGESFEPTKYGEYVLPGGENYRELLLMLPGEKIPQRKQWLLIDNATGEAVSARATEPNQRWLDDVATGEYSIREQMVNDDQADVRQGGTGFRSAHWDERNILAHVRFNDRTAADGNKVLFIEELQSDWGQDGKKKKGFRGDVSAVTNLPDGWSYKDVSGRVYLVSPTGREEGARRTADGEDAQSTAVKIYNALFAEDVRGTKPPNGPFVTDTKAWLSLGIKRMVAYAVENGYDKVAFVNGEQSADRYSLAKKISRLEWKSNKGEDSGVLIGWDADGNGLLEKEMASSEVEDYVGKELADRLINGPVNHETVRGRQVRRVEGAGLKVGGEGMKTFYDKIVPQTVSDVLKKLGGGKVEELTIPRGDLKYHPAGYKPTYTETKQLGFSITPALREKVSQGMPLFSLKRRTDQTETPEFKKWFGDSNLRNEDGSPMVLYHGTNKNFAVFKSSKTGVTGAGVYLGIDPGTGESYAGDEAGANVMPVYARGRYIGLDKWSQYVQTEGSWTKARAKAEADGVAGIIDVKIENAVNVFDPANLKSAIGNNGQFDSSNPDIRYSLRRRIDETLAKVDHAVDGLSNLPNQFDYLKDRYLALGKIARVDEISQEVRKAFDHASPGDKKAVYNYLVTRGATTSQITDPALKAIAKRIKDTINYTGDQLVARGLLDQQVRDQYKDQYLPRMYLRHMLDDDAVKAIGMGKKPSDLGYLKHRKDIPVEIRELVLGEIKDPAFLSVNAIGRAMRDVSLMDWMGKISQNNDWVFPEVFTQWKGRRVTAYWLRAEADRIERQAEHYEPANKAKATTMVAGMRSKANQTLGAMSSVDHKAYKQIPDTMRYGMLRGMWLRNEIYHDIMGASQIVNADPTWFEDWFGFGGKGTKMTQWWKFTKVALNPPGQIRNFVSNMVMLQLSGVGLHKLPVRLIEAARDISSNGPYWKIAKKYGVTESTFTAQEMFRVKRDLLDMEAQMGKMNPLRFLMSAGARFLEKVSDLYQFSEALGKTIKIIDEMKAGKSEAEAAIEAQKWLFDYSLVPQSVRIARNAPVGMPFLTYQVKVLPRLLEVAAKYPWRFLPWVGLLYGMQAAVASMFGVDDDELKKLKKSLPEWLQDRSHTVFLPMRDADGRLQVADVGYFFPWTFYSQIGMHAADGKVKKALVDDMGGMFSAPIIGAASALMTNYDTFTHKPIYNETDPVGYQAAAIANYAYDLMAPPFLSSHGVVSPMGLADKKFGGKLVQAETGTTNKFGDPKATEAQAIGALVGFNFYGMDPEHTRITNMQVMNMKVRDAERSLRQRLMDRSLSQEERNDVMQSYQAKMMDLQKEMVEYAKQSEVPQQLRVLKRQ